MSFSSQVGCVLWGVTAVHTTGIDMSKLVAFTVVIEFLVVKPPSLAVGVTHQPSLVHGLLCSLLADYKTGAWLPRASCSACYLFKGMFELCSQPFPGQGSMATDTAGRHLECFALLHWDPMGAYCITMIPSCRTSPASSEYWAFLPRLKYQVHDNIWTRTADPS